MSSRIKRKDYWVKENADFNKMESDFKITIENNEFLEVMLMEYSKKFMHSACEVTKHMLGTSSISVLDRFFFPIAFLFRHSLELNLKACLFQYITDAQERIELLVRTKHNLLDLLEELEPFIQEKTAGKADMLKWLKSFLHNINNIDKESDSFRYPFGITIEKKLLGDKKYGIKVLFDEQTHINLVKFGEKMLYAYEITEAIYNDNICNVEEKAELNPTLLEEGGSYYGQSVVGYKYSHDKFYPFVSAYSEVASVLYDLMYDSDEKKKAEIAKLIFLPMCYMFRNAVELSIKQTMFEESSYGFQSALNKMNKKKHKIEGLWNLIKKEVEEHAGADDENKTGEIAFNYIRQINVIDFAADKFRYPINNQLKVHFNEKVTYDIENVHEYFSEILSFLSGVNGMMSDHNESEAEMKAEWRAEMESEALQNRDYY